MPLIPNRDNDFENFGIKLGSAVAANPAVYGLTQPQADKIVTKMTNFSTKLSASDTARDLAQSATAEKNESRSDAEKDLREIIGIIYKFPDITPALLEAAGLPVHDNTHTTIVPVEPEELEAKADDKGNVYLNWSAGGNKQNTMYVVEFKRDPAAEFSFVDVVTATKYVHKGQPAGIRTSYRVKAKRGDLVSNPSQVVVLFE